MRPLVLLSWAVAGLSALNSGWMIFASALPSSTLYNNHIWHVVHSNVALLTPTGHMSWCPRSRLEWRSCVHTKLEERITQILPFCVLAIYCSVACSPIKAPRLKGVSFWTTMELVGLFPSNIWEVERWIILIMTLCTIKSSLLCGVWEHWVALPSFQL